MLDALTALLPQRGRRDHRGPSEVLADPPLAAAPAVAGGPSPCAPAEDSLRETFDLLEVDLDQAVAEGKLDTLNLIIKGDASGAVEALEDSLLKIEVGEDEVQLRVIHRGVGAITQNDVNLATVDDAIIIGFNVRPAERVADLADKEGVDMRFYSVIYDAIDDIENALKGMLKPEYEEVALG